MTKTTYASMKLKVNTQPKEIDFEGNKINVLQYLPIEDKYDLVMITLQKSLEDGIYNPIKKDMYFHLYMVYMYTDISFTEKQKENPTKLYDLLNGNGLLEKIIDAVPQTEYDELIHGIYDTIDAVYSYQNSVLGILDTISQDYSNLNLDATEIQKKLADPENMALLKNIMTKLG